MASKSLGLTLKNPSKVIKLSNLVSNIETMAVEEWAELGEDIQDECKKYGAVISHHVQTPGPEGAQVPAMGSVFVEFASTEDAAKVRGLL